MNYINFFFKFISQKPQQNRYKDSELNNSDNLLNEEMYENMRKLKDVNRQINSNGFSNFSGTALGLGSINQNQNQSQNQLP